MHFTYNPNILMPFWPTIRRYDRDKHIVGHTMLITYGKQRKEIGEAAIAHLSLIEFRAITNEIAFMVSGKGAHYVKGVLLKMYPDMQPTDTMAVLVLEWKQRYLMEQEDMVRQWWDAQVAQTPQYADYKRKRA
jgi:hypothetical protein